MSPSLEGRTVVITGAGRGIGREHALFLAAHGAQLVINDLGGGTDGSGSDTGPAQQLADEIVAAGGVAVANNDDISSTDGARRLIETAIEAFGDLHGLINNAGILRDRTLVNMSDDDWDVSIGVNLRGVFAPARAAAQYWRDRSKAGHTVTAAIVNTSSESGVFANAGQSNYAAAKAGVATLTEVWHKELGRYGVRVNGILPRARTRLTESLVGAPKGDGTRLDRWDPANVAPFVTYLVSDACTFSGQVFLVAGGVVQRATPWSLDPDWKLESDVKWDLDSLVTAVDKAGVPTNVGRDTGGVR
jgi:NAD(P)-dependent dehydrogenase (short-subunit alcohol dehydrogenase family)